MYVKKRGTHEILIVSLYVDDMIYTSSSSQLITQFMLTMKSRFEMTDLGELHYFLGLEVIQTRDGIFLSQKKYINDTLKKYNMLNCKREYTPMNVNEKLQDEDGTEQADGEQYRSLVGRLIYMTHSRPDISFAVGVLSRFMHCPTKHQAGAAKRVLRYLAGTRELGIWYRKSGSFCLTGSSDSDWGGASDGRSTTGNCFTVGSSLISWSSKNQATVALSSTEAEYVAMTATACQAVWLRRILGDMGQVQSKATVLYCDNRSAMLLAKNPICHSRTKHIEIKHHSIRELLSRGEVKLEECRTDQQLADLFTKSLTKKKHEELCAKLGMSKFG